MRNVMVVGDLIIVNGGTGVVFLKDNTSIRVVSAIETTAEWGPDDISTYAEDSYDGMANVEKVKNRGYYDHLPPFVWCGNYGKNWYLPAANESSSIVQNKAKINATLSTKGYKSLGDESDYWSSTEFNSSVALSWGRYMNRKSLHLCVRAILIF